MFLSRGNVTEASVKLCFRLSSSEHEIVIMKQNLSELKQQAETRHTKTTYYLLLNFKSKKSPTAAACRTSCALARRQLRSYRMQPTQFAEDYPNLCVLKGFLLFLKSKIHSRSVCLVTVPLASFLRRVICLCINKQKRVYIKTPSFAVSFRTG